MIIFMVLQNSEFSLNKKINFALIHLLLTALWIMNLIE